MYFKEGTDMHWEELFVLAQKVPQIKEFIQKNVDLVHDLFLIMSQPKAVSIHPCATIIIPKDGNKNVFDWLPLRQDKGQLISEWEGPELESIGLLKEDILGLSQLDKFQFILKLIKETTGKEINIYSIEIDDKKVMELFQKGFTSDVFQFGSKGLTNYCKDVLPDDLEELITMVALFRPGPIQSGAHHNYVNFKFKRKVPEYDFGLKEVTKGTYGLYIFQEQVMQACQVLGGFSLSDTDEVRRAMGKKKIEVIEPYKKQFITKAIEKGASSEEANKIWQKLEVFSAYGFNRSHAAAYALMGYISQWLKYYYPVQFWTAAFQFAEKEDLVLRYMSEIQQIDDFIKITPPDINVSGKGLKSDHKLGKIYWSLLRIKHLGEIGTDAILEERDKNGKFFSFEDFHKRMPKDIVNKRIITNLIVSGSFDEICEIKNIIQRKELVEKYYNLAGIEAKQEMLLQSQNVKEDWYWLLRQKEICGLGHFDFKAMIKNSSLSDYAVNYVSGEELQDELLVEKQVVFGGIVKLLTVRNSRKGKWALIDLDSNNATVFVHLWNPEWELYKDKLRDCEGKIMLFIGLVKHDSMYKKCNTIHFYNKHQLEILGESKEERAKKKVEKIIYKAGDVREFKDGPYKMSLEGKWRKVKI